MLPSVCVIYAHNIDREEPNNFAFFLLQAKPFLNKNDFSELVDPSLSNTYNSEQLNRMVLTAASCLHESTNERPQMSKASVRFYSLVLWRKMTERDIPTIFPISSSNGIVSFT